MCEHDENLVLSEEEADQLRRLFKALEKFDVSVNSLTGSTPDDLTLPELKRRIKDYNKLVY